jgi:hypothetical protein
VKSFGASDFSPETIEQRANEGYKQTEIALQGAAYQRLMANGVGPRAGSNFAGGAGLRMAEQD